MTHALENQGYDNIGSDHGVVMTDEPITPEALDLSVAQKSCATNITPKIHGQNTTHPSTSIQAPPIFQVRFDDNPDYGRKYMVYLVTRGIFSHSIALWNITTMQQLKTCINWWGTRNTK